MSLFSNNYVLGKGRLYFNHFVPGTKAGPGFKYFGNTPTLTVLRAATALDHFDSDNGVKVKDDSIDIQTDINGKFTCDNISADNLALWFAGISAPFVQAAGGTALTENFTIYPDMYFQLGVTPNTPAGLRNLTGLTVTAGQAALPNDGSAYEFDPTTGLLHILPGAAGVTDAGFPATINYSLGAGSQGIVIEQGVTVFGALKFISSNPKGIQRDYFYPYVKITPDVEIALKGDTWQTAGFGYEALQLDANTRRVYSNTRT